MNRESIHGGRERESRVSWLCGKGMKKQLGSQLLCGYVVVCGLYGANFFLQSMFSSWNECLAGQLFFSGFLKPTCVGRLRVGGEGVQFFLHICCFGGGGGPSVVVIVPPTPAGR